MSLLAPLPHAGERWIGHDLPNVPCAACVAGGSQGPNQVLKRTCPGRTRKARAGRRRTAQFSIWWCTSGDVSPCGCTCQLSCTKGKSRNSSLLCIALQRANPHAIKVDRQEGEPAADSSAEVMEAETADARPGKLLRRWYYHTGRGVHVRSADAVQYHSTVQEYTLVVKQETLPSLKRFFFGRGDDPLCVALIIVVHLSVDSGLLCDLSTIYHSSGDCCQEPCAG